MDRTVTVTATPTLSLTLTHPCAGELTFTLSWEPYATAAPSLPAAAAAAADAGFTAAFTAATSVQPSAGAASGGASTGADGGVGSFWDSEAADSAFVSPTPTPTPAHSNTHNTGALARARAAAAASPPSAAPPLAAGATAAAAAGATNASMGGGGGGGAFWTSGFADDFATFDVAPSAATTAPTSTPPLTSTPPYTAGPTSRPPQPASMGAGSFGTGADSFWGTDAAAATAWDGRPTTGAAAASATPQPPPLVFTASATEFEAVKTLAVPWEPSSSSSAGNTSTTPADAGSFWASFDPSPVGPATTPDFATTPPDAVTTQSATHAAHAPSAPSLIDFGAAATSTPGAANDLWSDLAQIDGGAAGAHATPPVQQLASTMGSSAPSGGGALFDLS
jgi:hypothetical protein